MTREVKSTILDRLSRCQIVTISSQPPIPADGDNQGQHQRTARKDRSRDEIRRENRAVPSRYLGHREIP